MAKIGEKIAPDCSKWGQEDFFLLIQTLPTFWATRILILRLFMFCIFLDSKFPDFQVPRSPNFQNPRLAPRSLNFQIPRFPDAAGAACGQTLRSQPDPSPNAPRDQIRREEPLLQSLRWLLRFVVAVKSTALKQNMTNTKCLALAQMVFDEWQDV